MNPKFLLGLEPTVVSGLKSTILTICPRTPPFLFVQLVMRQHTPNPFYFCLPSLIQNCDSHAAVSTIVGRNLVSRETSSCFECCSTDRCNSALCLHPGRKSDAVYVLNMFLFIH
jgi:hypothetical protein